MVAWTCVQRRVKKDHIEKDVRWWHGHVCRGEGRRTTLRRMSDGGMDMCAEEREEGPH